MQFDREGVELRTKVNPNAWVISVQLAWPGLSVLHSMTFGILEIS